MNTTDDRDEVGDLLRQGYAGDVDRSFAASLLTRLQKEMRPRSTRRWMVAGAVAAGVAILLGVATIMYCLNAGPSAPVVAKAPIGEAGLLVIRGRMLKWDAPIAEFAVCEVLRGKPGAATVYADLSGGLGDMRRYVLERSANRAATAPAESEISARAATLFATQLNMAAGTDMVLELGPRSQWNRLARQGRIMKWGGITDLPPRDRHDDVGRAIINVVADGSACALRPRPGDLLMDEWGMPR